jgi:methanogenic corrinoid protein MtbC1
MRDFGSSERRWIIDPPGEPRPPADARRHYARKRAAEAVRERCRALGRVVQTEIVPKLVLHHRGAMAGTTDIEAKQIEAEVAAFTDLALASDDGPVIQAFEALMAAGHSPNRLFLELLAPSAALLGRMWDEDLCDFVEVTTGVARLQRLVARFRAGEEAASLDGRRRLLLMGTPGEQHTLGVRVVEEFCRRAGWTVSVGLSSTPEEIAALVASQWFGVVGLTLSSETQVDQLTVAIRSVRAASRNPAIGVMVGGPMVLQHPELVRRVGADASAVDAPTAVLLAQHLLDLTTDHAPPPDPTADGTGDGEDAGRPTT